jgi:hypothetical protein
MKLNRALENLRRPEGYTVIFFDPIFQGLAISLMAGEVLLYSSSAPDRAGRGR